MLPQQPGHRGGLSSNRSRSENQLIKAQVSRWEKLDAVVLIEEATRAVVGLASWMLISE
jgi:hypothetical protein